MCNTILEKIMAIILTQCSRIQFSTYNETGNILSINTLNPAVRLLGDSADPNSWYCCHNLVGTCGTSLGAEGRNMP